MQRFGHFIGGTWRNPINGQWMPTIDPYSSEPWAEVARGDSHDVAAAVEDAQAALTGWKSLTGSQRGAYLRKFADMVADRAAELADIEVRDNGKLLTEVMGQCQMLSGWIHYFAGYADKIEGRIPPHERPDTLGLVTYEPYGVCAGITPWNSPLLQLVWKLAPALAAGNVFVLKPSEYTPVSSLRLAEIAVQAGLPKGVFNVVTGFGNEVGVPLVDHPLVRRVAFTGGEPGGLAIGAAAARKLIPASLELGGKSANVVFADADFDAATGSVAAGIFAACGQSCVAGSRLIVHDDLHDSMLARLVEIAERVKHGDPRDPSVQMGPVATSAQHERILAFIDKAKKEGARLAAGGVAGVPPPGNRALYIRPTIFSDVTTEMHIAREEVFGPVLSVMRFSDEEEAIRIANASDYGLAAGVWTRDLARAIRVSQRIEAGTVWVNRYRAVSYVMPFGGYKRSGVGRENGMEVMKEYLQVKSIHVNLSAAPVVNPFVKL